MEINDKFEVMNTPLSEEIAIKYGFKQINKDPQKYQMEINLPYPGKRLLTIHRFPHNWICLYSVDGIDAVETKYYLEEVLELYKAITGKELKENDTN